MSIVSVDIESGSDASTKPRRTFDLERVCVSLVGEAADWFATDLLGESLLIRPKRPLPVRCLIRPVALFRDPRGFPAASTVMGRLLFQQEAGEGQHYTPFTYDAQRELEELFLLVEATPDDDLFSSRIRWFNAEHVARKLCGSAHADWNGFRPRDVDDLLSLEPWQEPLEGCTLNALAQWSHASGACVIEIGSLRGQSTAMLAMALRTVESRAALISIDPHLDHPQNSEQVRLTLSHIGEQRRLVQFTQRSDEVWRLLSPGGASMIFIDGDHSYRQVVADFENYRHVLAPGGCMVFHDYGYGAHNGRPDVVADVRPAIDEHVMGVGEFRPLLLANTLMAFVKDIAPSPTLRSREQWGTRSTNIRAG